MVQAVFLVFGEALSKKANVRKVFLKKREAVNCLTDLGRAFEVWGMVFFFFFFKKTQKLVSLSFCAISLKQNSKAG